MATAKKATSKAAAKKGGQAKTGTSMARWDEKLAALAQQNAATAATTGGGYKSISTKGGLFTVDGEAAGEELDVVIVGFTLENAYYTADYDPDNPSSPVCFAFGDDAKTMAPIPEDVEELQNEKCRGCPQNEFGSAERGNGKACKNQAKLLVIDPDDLDDLANAEPRTLKVAVTSVQNLSAYVKDLETKFRRPPLAYVTKLKLVRDPKTQFKMLFSIESEIEDGDIIGGLLDMHEAKIVDLRKPYEPISEEQKAERAANKNRGRGGKARGKAEATGPSRGVAARGKASQGGQQARAGRRGR